MTRFIAVRPWPRLALAAANDSTPEILPVRGTGRVASRRLAEGKNLEIQT